VRLLSPSLNATLLRRAQVRVRAGAVHPQPRPGASAPGQPAPRGPARNATRAKRRGQLVKAGQMRPVVKCGLTRARRAAPQVEAATQKRMRASGKQLVHPPFRSAGPSAPGLTCPSVMFRRTSTRR
jgi:hypothetical protein